MPSKRNVSYHAYNASSPMNRHKIAEFDRLLPVWRRGLAYAMGVWTRMLVSGVELPHWMKRFLIIKCDSHKPGLLYRGKSGTFLLPGFYLCVDLVKELADNFLDFCHCII